MWFLNTLLSHTILLLFLHIFYLNINYRYVCTLSYVSFCYYLSGVYSNDSYYISYRVLVRETYIYYA